MKNRTQETTAKPDNRMLKYGNAVVCPECLRHPAICRVATDESKYFRCSRCGHKWEAILADGVFHLDGFKNRD